MRGLLLLVAAGMVGGCQCSSTTIAGSALDGGSLADGRIDGITDPGPDSEPPCGIEMPAGCDVLLGYGEPPCPEIVTLAFTTHLGRADVFFALDSSHSMMDEIANLHASLREVVVPGILASIPDTWFGVGRFEDCNDCPSNMAMLQGMTSDITLVEEALGSMRDPCGGSEPYTQILHAIATGDVASFEHWGGVHPLDWSCEPPGATGWPCFREHSVPIIVQFGDEDFLGAVVECDPGVSIDQAVASLNSISARYIGVNSSLDPEHNGFDNMVSVAEGTASVDSSGSPLVFTIPSDGTGLGTQVVEAIDLLSIELAVDLSTEARHGPHDPVDARIFIDYIEPDSGSGRDPAFPSRTCPVDPVMSDTDGDTRPDMLPSCMAPTACFDVHFLPNEFFEPGPEVESFEIIIDLLADGGSVLDSRTLVLCVP
jgi:hypothetical protein